MTEIPKSNELPHIRLIGNPEENFYSLGRRDKEGYVLIQKQITQLCMRSEYAAKFIKKITEFSKDYSKRGSIDLMSVHKAYAEGLEIPLNDLHFNLLLPEVVASFNKWLPHLLGIIPGCSSLFIWDKKNQGVIHGRILDYSLCGPFEQYERSISYDFTNRLKSFSYSTVGMPFPALSTINEKGLTIALHYKHGDYFDINGNSIFSLLYQAISYCTNIQELKKYLQSHASIGHWGIYASDAGGNIASLDIRGNEVYFEKFDLKEHDFLYFNNRPLVSTKQEELLQPYGNKNQCLMRKDSLFDKMKNFNYEAKDLGLETIKVLSDLKPKKQNSAINWKMPTITPSSLQVLTFHNSLNESLFLTGSSPKIFKGHYQKTESIFKDLKTQVSSSSKKVNLEYTKGLEYLSQSQSAMDNGHSEQAYHQLQMAIQFLQDYPEEKIAKFFFIIWQYIHEDSQKDFSYLYQELLDLENLLPEYLNDHRILFISRLNKILGLGIDKDLRGKIIDENLKVIYDKEIKMKKIAIKLLRKFTIPRIEILDIIYIYA